MKFCPKCKREYIDSTLAFCLEDGSPLVERYDSSATLVNRFPGQSDSEMTEVITASSNPFSEAPTQVKAAPKRPPEPTLVVSPAPNYYAPPPGAQNSGRAGRYLIIVGLGLVVVVVITGVSLGVLFWIMQKSGPTPQPVVTKPNQTPASTPESTPADTPTPSQPVEVAGKWYGAWNNSKGSTGNSTIVIFEAADGTIAGGEGSGWDMVNGTREGNVVTWEYHNINDCLDYTCRFEVDDTGEHGHGTYQVHDKCEDEDFTGSYLDYTKQ